MVTDLVGQAESETRGARGESQPPASGIAGAPRPVNRPADPDSRARTHLANERTFLAWLRTGLALIVLGIGSAQFVAKDQHLVKGVPVVWIFSSFLIVAGATLVVMGQWRYDQSRERIETQSFRPANRTVKATTLLVIAIAVGALLLVMLLRGV